MNHALEQCTEFQLTGAFKDAEVYVRRVYGYMHYEIRWSVPDRDTGEPVTLTFAGPSLPVDLAQNPELRASCFRNAVRELAVHEADEAIMRNGVRIFDPHSNERPYP